MPDVLSNWAANAALDLVLPTGCYLACHVSDPSPLGNTGSEVAGGAYQRQPISFADASNRTRVSVNAQTFPGMPACIVTHLAVWTAIGGGHLVFSRALLTPMPVLASGQVRTAAGDVALSL